MINECVWCGRILRSGYKTSLHSLCYECIRTKEAKDKIKKLEEIEIPRKHIIRILEQYSNKKELEEKQ